MGEQVSETRDRAVLTAARKYLDAREMDRRLDAEIRAAKQQQAEARETERKASKLLWEILGERDAAVVRLGNITYYLPEPREGETLREVVPVATVIDEVDRKD